MQTTELYADFLLTDVALPKHELLEVHRSKISLHHAEAGYSCPTIRLLYMFSKLAELPTRVYQTAHDGALAFPVVLSRSLPAKKSRDIGKRSN